MSDSFGWQDVVVREMATGQGRKKPKGRQYIYCEEVDKLRKAALLPGMAGWVWLLAHHRSKIAKGGWTTLPQGMLDEWGIGRSSKSRALSVLQKAGLIELECIFGRSVRVRVPNTERQELDEA
jgi:hypothetical protein